METTPLSPLEEKLIPQERGAVTVEGGNPREHFVDARILKLAQALWKDDKTIDVYKGGLVTIRDMDLKNINMLLGVDEEGKLVDSGFKFSTTLEDGTKVVSTVLSQGKARLPNENDSDQITTNNKVDVVYGEKSFYFNLEIEKLKISPEKTVYSIKIMPSPEHEEDCLAYYDLLAKRIIATSDSKK